MSSKGKRFLASLIGLHLSEDPPDLESLVPNRIQNEIMCGRLPRFNPTTIMLNSGESCHYMNRAALALQKTEKSYHTKRHGGGYKLSKKYTVFSSGSTTKPIEQSWYEFKEGVVFVTNQRIIFVAPENGFEKKLKVLTAVIPYSDAITLQFGSQTITLILPDSQLMAMVLKMVH